jgi:hypothetical protein
MDGREVEVYRCGRMFSLEKKMNPECGTAWNIPPSQEPRCARSPDIHLFHNFRHQWDAKK